MVGVDAVQDDVALEEAVLEPQRARQLRARLVGRGRVTIGLGDLDGGPEAGLGGGRIVEVPELVERGHGLHASGRSQAIGRWSIRLRAASQVTTPVTVALAGRQSAR